MSLPLNTVLLPSVNTVFLTSGGLVLGSDAAQSIGSFRFLKDHYINGEFISAGEIRTMLETWAPTPDVEPLDTLAVNAFYAQGPTLGAVIRTQFIYSYIYAPTTYWRQVAPNLWGLTGLGSGKAPIAAIVARLEDKAP